jgi:hypothetical protein
VDAARPNAGGVTFADAAAEWLRYIDRERKPSTVAGFKLARELHGLSVDPAADAEKPPPHRSGDIQVSHPRWSGPSSGAQRRRETKGRDNS